MSLSLATPCACASEMAAIDAKAVAAAMRKNMTNLQQNTARDESRVHRLGRRLDQCFRRAKADRGCDRCAAGRPEGRLRRAREAIAWSLAKQPARAAGYR